MTMSRYQFTFDSSTCSGCKACQVACKDRNGLEVGRLWRRVYEVSGGGWQQAGAAWLPGSFAYYLSIACNHCERPICAEVCPTQAITQRSDGIVVLDEQRCIGCKYCHWACPYGALQYNPAAGSMSKCNFCLENLAQGLPPACVAACGLRSLDYELCDGKLVGPAVIPLPDPAWTGPALQVIPHRDAVRAQDEAARVANLEEVHPAAHGSELPLALFTVLAQLAVGLVLVAGVVVPWFAIWTGLDTALGLFRQALLIAWAALGLGLLLSLFHLGRPLSAYRALYGLRNSWLSREILLAGLCFAGLAAYAGLQTVQPDSLAVLAVYFWSGLSGLGLVFAMGRVYRQRTLPGWDTWRTPGSFYLTVGLLGLLLVEALLAPASARLSLFAWVRGGALVGLMLGIVDFYFQGWFSRQIAAHSVETQNFASLQGRLCMLGAGIILLGVLLAPGIIDWLPPVLWAAFLLSLAGQFLGRLRFYRILDRRAL